MPVKVHSLVVGAIQTNCHIVYDGESPEVMIVDPGGDADVIAVKAKSLSLDPKWIVLTHCHGDHIAGLGEVKRRFPDAKIAAHEADAPALTDANLNLSGMLGTPFTAPPADRVLNENDEIQVGALSFRVIHTPGHTPGGICLYAEGDPPVLLAGDTLFAGSVGRSDFPGGSHEQLIDSIKTKLLVLPDETRVYTGHGPVTTIGEEKDSNPFLR